MSASARPPLSCANSPRSSPVQPAGIFPTELLGPGAVFPSGTHQLNPSCFLFSDGSWLLFSPACPPSCLDKDTHTYTSLLGSPPASEGQPRSQHAVGPCPASAAGGGGSHRASEKCSLTPFGQCKRVGISAPTGMSWEDRDLLFSSPQGSVTPVSQPLVGTAVPEQVGCRVLGSRAWWPFRHLPHGHSGRTVLLQGPLCGPRAGLSRWTVRSALGKGQGLEELGSGQPRGPSATSLEPEARVVTIQVCQPEGLLQSSQRRWPMSVAVPVKRLTVRRWVEPSD